jgi:hypothetical protein
MRARLPSEPGQAVNPLTRRPGRGRQYPIRKRAARYPGTRRHGKLPRAANATVTTALITTAPAAASTRKNVPPASASRRRHSRRASANAAAPGNTRALDGRPTMTNPAYELLT